MEMTIKCPECKGTNCVKRGTSPTRNRGKQQRRLCKDCRKTFIVDLGFWKMKNKETIVTMSIDMYLSNLSSRKMRNQLMRHFETKTSHVSVLDWVRKYTLKVQKYINSLTPSLSGEYYADETEIPRGAGKVIRGSSGADIFWCSVDWGTRYINATLYSPEQQSVEDATEFIRRIKQSGKPKFIQTDAAQFYPRAFDKNFRTLKGTYDDVEHRIQNVRKTKVHNVRIETLFSKIKDRVHDFRGLKALWSAPIIMAGIVIQHNFIEPHTTTGMHPCELAGITFSLSENRWMGLIRLSSVLQ